MNRTIKFKVFNDILDCFSEVGISSNATADASISSSTHVSSKEGHKGRLNMESVWEACQFGSCSPKESSGNKPWIQICLSSILRVSSIIVQGPGNFDNIAKVTEFSLKFGTSSSGSFQSYNLGGTLKVNLTSIDIFLLIRKGYKRYFVRCKT